MQLSVIIPFHSRRDTLSACLGALSRSVLFLKKHRADARIEIIIINDCSPIFPDKIEVGCDFRVLTFNENQGASAVRNAGIREAKYPWFLCLDSDVLIHEDFLLELERLISSGVRAPVIQGVMTHEVGGNQKGLFSLYMALSFAFDTYEYLYDDHYSYLLCSGCFASQKSFMTEIGFFDTRFKGSGGEEFEILSRMPAHSIFQAATLKADHIYDALLPRLKKVFKRSEHYLEVAALNSCFPRKLKNIGIMRSLLSALATAFLVVAVFGHPFFFLGHTLSLVVVAFADGGKQLKYVFRHSNAPVAILTPLFIYLEYVVALSGMFKSRVIPRKRYAQ